MIACTINFFFFTVEKYGLWFYSVGLLNEKREFNLYVTQCAENMQLKLLLPHFIPTRVQI